VLDLRGTRYGYLRLVQSLVSRFVNGPDLVTLVGRDQQGQSSVVQVPSVSNVQAVNTPVAVLVDQSTGNEAEIFALAIQNKRKGSVFGRPTAGCPVASIPFQLSDNSIMNVSIYRSIEDGSDPNSWVADVTPDVAVSLDQQSLSQGLDAQLEKAVAFIKS
jgi:C-terminal processing protease CtpA/Prc